MKGTKVYVLIQASKGENGTFSDFDVYGIYSSEELANKVMKSLKRKDGRYDGIIERHDWALIIEKIIDNNFPDNGIFNVYCDKMAEFIEEKTEL